MIPTLSNSHTRTLRTKLKTPPLKTGWKTTAVPVYDTRKKALKFKPCDMIPNIAVRSKSLTFNANDRQS